MFRKLLQKLYKGYTFSINENLIRQIDGCPMGGPILVVLSNIFWIKREHDVVSQIKPNLGKCYVYEIVSKCVKNNLMSISEG